MRWECCKCLFHFVESDAAISLKGLQSCRVEEKQLPVVPELPDWAAYDVEAGCTLSHLVSMKIIALGDIKCYQNWLYFNKLNYIVRILAIYDIYNQINYISKDSLSTYIAAPNGYWYQYLNKVEEDN